MVYVKTSESFLSPFSIEGMGTAPVLKDYAYNAYFLNERLAKDFIDDLKKWIRINYSVPVHCNYYISMSSKSYFTNLSWKEVDSTHTIDHVNFLYFDDLLVCENFIKRLIVEIRRLNSLHSGLNLSL